MKISGEETKEIMESVLDSGDDVLIHASLGKLGFFEDGIESLIRSICDAVGPSGTVIMMTDTRSFAKTGEFSLDQPSETGLLTECFRKMDGVRRSCVPMVSFCASGARAADYTELYDSHLDETAAISRLLKNDGKIMLLGVGYEKCTLYHLAEERHQAPYNMYKTFSGVLVRHGQPSVDISQRYFVRRDTSIRKDPSIAGSLLERDGLAQIAQLGNGTVRVFSARDFDDCCMSVLEKDPEAFLV